MFLHDLHSFNTNKQIGRCDQTCSEAKKGGINGSQMPRLTTKSCSSASPSRASHSFDTTQPHLFRYCRFLHSCSSILREMTWRCPTTVIYPDLLHNLWRRLCLRSKAEVTIHKALPDLMSIFHFLYSLPDSHHIYSQFVKPVFPLVIVYLFMYSTARAVLRDKKENGWSAMRSSMYATLSNALKDW